MTVSQADIRVEAPTVVLTSSSPRRLAILQGLGLEPVVVSVDVDEVAHPGENPGDMVLRLAIDKVRRGCELAPMPGPCLYVGADTTIDLDGVSLGKPQDEQDARRMLQALSGRTHRAVTGLAVLAVGFGRVVPELVAQTEETAVTFVELSDADIEWYLQTKEPFGKAGAYTIQGVGSWMIKHVDGSFHSVVGLPPALLDTMTRSLGWPLRQLAHAAGAVAA